MSATAVPLLGREAELRGLERALEVVEAGRSWAVGVVGEPGIGKSRLLAELGRRADASGLRVLSGRAGELERDLTFAVLADALEPAVSEDVLAQLEPWQRGELAAMLPSVGTNPIRAAVDRDGADDGEPGEGDELLQVGKVIGGSAGDTMLVPLNRINGFGIGFDGGPGADTIRGTNARDFLTGGPGTDELTALGGDDQLFSNDGEPVDRLFCGAGLDTATTDTVEKTVSDCNTRTVVGTLRLAPARLQAKAGETAHLRLSWRHPQGWRKLRAIELRLTREGVPMGEITIHPRGGRISDRGAVEVMRKRTRLTRKGKTVAARLAVRLDASLAGQTLDTEVEATDTRGRRQLELDAGTVRVAE